MKTLNFFIHFNFYDYFKYFIIRTRSIDKLILLNLLDKCGQNFRYFVRQFDQSTQYNSNLVKTFPAIDLQIKDIKIPKL